MSARTPRVALGHYSLAVKTGAMAAGAGADSQVFSARWTHATKLAVIEQILITGMRVTTAFLAGVIDIKATIARAFTVSASGPSAITLTGSNNKTRTSMATSLFGSEMFVADTSPLTAGTQVLDSNDVGQIVAHSSGGVGSAVPIIGAIYLPALELFAADMDRGQHPIVLAQDEGVVVRATVPAIGVWSIGIKLVWSEVNAYPA